MKPLLAIPYDVNCFSPLEIATAVGEDCDLIWIVDTSEALGPMGPMLARTGTVVDVAHLAPEARITAVGELGSAGIVAFSDSQLATAASIAAGLHLPHNSPAVIRRFLDKYEQRVALRDAGIAVPGFVAIPANAPAAQVAELAAALTLPAVLKPRYGSGSRDTYRIEHADALVELLAPGSGLPVISNEACLLEEYLPDAHPAAGSAIADYVSVESVVVAGRARHLAVTGKFPLAAPFRETGNFLPCALSSDGVEAVLALTDRALAALGAQTGCLHTEIKLTPAGPRLIESNARVGGGGIEHIFFMSCRESLVRIAAMAALGFEVPTEIKFGSGEVTYQLFIQAPVSAHRLVRADGLDEVSALPGVAQVFLNRGVGDTTDWKVGSQGYVATVRGAVPDHDALCELRARVLEQFDFEYS